MVFLLLGVLSPAGALLAGAAVSPTGDRAKNFCRGAAVARLQPAGARHHGVGVRHSRPRCAAVSPTDRAKNFWVLCGRDGVPPAGRRVHLLHHLLLHLHLHHLHLHYHLLLNLHLRLHLHLHLHLHLTSTPSTTSTTSTCRLLAALSCARTS